MSPRFLCRLVSLLVVGLLPSAAAAETLVYFGTYTRPAVPPATLQSEGIYVATLDANGQLGEPRLAARAQHPSYLALHPEGTMLYAVGEVADFATEPSSQATNRRRQRGSGGVVAFRIEADGTLTETGREATGGGGACHLSLTPDARTLLVANYGGGSVASFALDENGGLGERVSFHQHVGGSGVNERRQQEPHAHAFRSVSDSLAYAPDLGQDRLKAYLVVGSTLQPAESLDAICPPGGGPRHLAVAPGGRFLVSNMELTSQLVSFELLEGERPRQVTVASTLPDDADPQLPAVANNSTAECLFHPSGRFVFVSNRGHNSIASFVFDAQDGQLSKIGVFPAGVDTPRGMGVTPDGRYLIACGQRDDTVVVHAITDDGRLEPHGSPIQIGVPVNAVVLQR